MENTTVKSTSTSSHEASVLNRTLPTQGSAGKSTKPPDRALAGQTGGGAGDAATRRLEVVSLQPPPRRLTKAQKEALALAAVVAADKAAAAGRRQRYIQGRAALLGVTVDEAEKKAQAENEASRLWAQKKWANSHIREPRTSPDIVWGGKDVGWVPRE